MTNLIFRPLTERQDFKDLKRLDKLLVKTFDNQIELLTVLRIDGDYIETNQSLIDIERYLIDTGVYRHIYLVK